MKKALWVLPAAASAMLVVPACAFASTGDSVTAPVRLGAELVGLLVALVLLVQTRRIRTELAGSAFAEEVMFVVLATLCLAASAVFAWAQGFVPAQSGELVGFGAQLLVIAAMGLLVAYFARVRATLKTLLIDMSGEDEPASTQGDGK
ncbi:MAG TPA: hypothetical protein VFG89_06200 [Coriobacteriia bacterium]|nr:hypothetical protein [Coriobacteriia bacterium]